MGMSDSCQHMIEVTEPVTLEKIKEAAGKTLEHQEAQSLGAYKNLME